MTRIRTAASVFAAVLVFATIGGPAPAAGIVHDSQSLSGSFAGSSDLTVRVTNASVGNAAVSTNDSGAVVVTLRLDDANAVDESRVTVRVDDHPVRTAVTCDDTCTLRIPASKVAHAADPGGHELRVTGWWTYDRQFVATLPITVEQSPEPPTTTTRNATTTNTTTNATTQTSTTQTTARTTSDTTSTTTERTHTTTTQTSTTTTSTATATATATSTATATATATSTATATATATNTTTATATATNTTTATTTQTSTTTATTTAVSTTTRRNETAS